MLFGIIAQQFSKLNFTITFQLQSPEIWHRSTEQEEKGEKKVLHSSSLIWPIKNDDLATVSDVKSPEL